MAAQCMSLDRMSLDVPETRRNMQNLTDFLIHKNVALLGKFPRLIRIVYPNGETTFSIPKVSRMRVLLIKNLRLLRIIFLHESLVFATPKFTGTAEDKAPRGRHL
jgi:hypothetical protein